MSKVLVVLFTILNCAGIVMAQQVPQYFELNKDGQMNKSTVSDAANPLSNSVSDIIAFGDTIWIGTGKGISLSTDNGESWTNFYGNATSGTNSISAIGYDQRSRTFWAALAYNTELNGSDIQTGGGLVYTSDMGQTWGSIPQPVDDPGDSTLVYGINNGVDLPMVRALPVTVPQQNLTFDIAFTPGTIWITSFAGGLRKASTDSLFANPNYKWERVLLPGTNVDEISLDDTIRFALSPAGGRLGFDENLNHRAFSVISANDTTLYVGTADGINKSTDKGVSWRKFTHTNQLNPISGNFVVALGYHPSQNIVYGATWRAEGQTEFYGVSSSSDGGETWQTFLEGQRAHNFGFKGNSVIAAADEGAFRSTDNGTSWILPTSIVDNQTKLSLKTDIFYAASSSGDNIWLGSAEGLVKLEETSNTVWQGEWSLYIASEALASKTETYAFPNPFSPKLDILKIKYSTGTISTPVTIRIFDFAMNYVRTVIQNAERGGQIHVADDTNSGTIDYWDGRDDDGNIVPNGVYFYSVETGSGDPVYGKILVIQ